MQDPFVTTNVPKGGVTKRLARQGSPDRPGRQAANQDGGITRWLRMDKNDDDKISPEEAQGQLTRNFDRVDINDDSFVDPNKLEELLEFLKKGARGKRR